MPASRSSTGPLTERVSQTPMPIARSPTNSNIAAANCRACSASSPASATRSRVRMRNAASASAVHCSIREMAGRSPAAERLSARAVCRASAATYSRRAFSSTAATAARSCRAALSSANSSSESAIAPRAAISLDMRIWLAESWTNSSASSARRRSSVRPRIRPSSSDAANSVLRSASAD